MAESKEVDRSETLRARLLDAVSSGIASVELLRSSAGITLDEMFQLLSQMPAGICEKMFRALQRKSAEQPCMAPDSTMGLTAEAYDAWRFALHYTKYVPTSIYMLVCAEWGAELYHSIRPHDMWHAVEHNQSNPYPLGSVGHRMTPFPISKLGEHRWTLAVCLGYVIDIAYLDMKSGESFDPSEQRIDQIMREMDEMSKCGPGRNFIARNFDELLEFCYSSSRQNKWLANRLCAFVKNPLNLYAD
jgi:hypothetical protein